MGPVGVWLVLLTVVMLAGMAFVPPTAQAASDTITELSVDFDIQADGSVAVRYELDWQFGSDGRHGIDFGIATRESWDADRTKDVVYDITDVEVMSPSGAPATFTRRQDIAGSVGRLNLRIGDRNKTVEGREATYVISYVVRGALRTFDGQPEFFWDVTGEDYPGIEHFTIRVTAPEGVTKSRCAVGTSECDTGISEGSAVYSGDDVATGSTVTVVAAIAPGSVRNAEPVLEERGVRSPTVTDAVSVVGVLPDGLTHIEQKLTYKFPLDHASDPYRVHWELPTRRPFSPDQDQVFRILNLQVDGGEHVVNEDGFYPGAELGNEGLSVRVTPQAGDTAVLRLSYDVEGAVTTEGYRATASWVLVPGDLDDAGTLDFTWNLPGQVQEVRCTTFGRSRREPGDCPSAMTFTQSDATVSWSAGDEVPRYAGDVWVSVDVPAASVQYAEPLLERGKEAAARRDKAVAVGGAIATFLGVAALGAGVGRGRFRPDKRWSGVPPGVTTALGGPVRRARRGDIVPVRFEVPECSLLLAGLVMDRRPRPQHTAAVLVGLAAKGAVKVQSRPLIVEQVSDEIINDYVESQLFDAATKKATPISKTRLQRMNRAVTKEQQALLSNASLFAPVRGSGRMGGLIVVLVAIVALFLVLRTTFGSSAVRAPMQLLQWWNQYLFWIVGAAVLGLVIGALISRGRPSPRPLEPGGTALRDQVDGFRQYIAKAEANQLNFEADQDIYRRYLPWAVLFGLTKRWTTVCQQLVDTGHIPPLNTSFWVGQESAATIAASIPSMSGGFQSAGTSSFSPSGFFSGDGSGGSSGFSGGSSSGGGGGGGTSASSW